MTPSITLARARPEVPTVLVGIAVLLVACGTSPGARSSRSLTPEATALTFSSASQSPSPSASLPPSVDLGAAAWSTKHGFGGLWIQVDPPIDQMVKVDVATGEIAMAIDGAIGVAFTDDGVWVAMAEQGELRKLDPLSGDTLLTVPGGGEPMTSGAGSVWAVGSDRQILRVDPASGELLAAIPIDATDLTNIAVDDDGAWVTGKDDGKVFRIDPTTNAVVAEVETGAGANGIVIDSSGVWVSNYRENSVSRIDPATNDGRRHHRG
jgi:virginiamycin B lyase